MKKKIYVITEELIKYYWEDAYETKAWVGERITLTNIAHYIELSKWTVPQEFFRKVLEEEYNTHNASNSILEDSVNDIKKALINRLDALEKEKGPEVVECGFSANANMRIKNKNGIRAFGFLMDDNHIHYSPERPVEDLAKFIAENIRDDEKFCRVGYPTRNAAQRILDWIANHDKAVRR